MDVRNGASECFLSQDCQTEETESDEDEMQDDGEGIKPFKTNQQTAKSVDVVL